MDGVIWNKIVPLDSISVEYAKACEWISKADKEGIKKELKIYFSDFSGIGSFLLRSEHLPERHYSDDRPPYELIKRLLRISMIGSYDRRQWAVNKDKMEQACCELLQEYATSCNETGLDSENCGYYLFNLAAMLTTLQVEGDILKTCNEKVFENLYKLAASGDFSGKKTYYNIDLQNELLGDISSYAITREWRDRMVDICEKYIGDKKCAAVCYQKLWEINPNNAILKLGDFIKASGLRGFANCYAVEKWLGEEWSKEAIERNLNFFVETMIPLLFESGTADRLRHINLIGDDGGIDIPEPVATNFMMPDGREEILYVMKPEIKIRSEKYLGKKNGEWIKEYGTEIIRGEKLNQLLGYETVQKLGSILDKQKGDGLSAD